MDKGTEESTLEPIHQFLKGRVFSNGVNRRQLLNHTVGCALAHRFSVAAALSLAGCQSTFIVGKNPAKRPNIIFIMADDLGYLNQRRAHTYYPPYLWRNEQKVILEGNKDGRRKQYSHDLFTDFALDYIRRHEDEPFFLYLPYTIPHANYEIPSTEPYTDKPWPADAKVHAAMITRMDADIGRIMSLLKELAIDKQTLVFFCSDNGAAQRWEGIFDSSGPLRGHKTDLYEGGIRTLMIVRWRNYKAVRSAPKKPLELYDLNKDIAEKHDIAAQHPDVVARIEEYLKTARTDSPNWPV